MRGSLPDLSKIVAAVQQAAPELAEEIADKVAKYAPVGPGPTGGRFANSIHGTADSTDTGAVLHIGSDSDKPKASWILQGTAAHLIPVNHETADGRPGFLRFELQGGDVVFTHGPVHHPGTSANPFPEKAAGDISDVLHERLPQIIRGAVTPS